jgi:hypothetical protein
MHTHTHTHTYTHTHTHTPLSMTSLEFMVVVPRSKTKRGPDAFPTENAKFSPKGHPCRSAVRSSHTLAAHAGCARAARRAANTTVCMVRCRWMELRSFL